MAGFRRKNPIVSRRRVEDEGDEEEGPDVVELEDDSLSEGSVITDEDDVADGSDTSHADVTSMLSPDLGSDDLKDTAEHVNGKIKSNKSTTARSKSNSRQKIPNGISDTEMMLNGLKISDENSTVEEVYYDDLQDELDTSTIVEPSSTTNSNAQMDLPQDTPLERRRREHEEYKKKRDADPAFVPNRGAFFMHDHRHSGPAANGFRPFGRGRGRGRTSIGGPFSPAHSLSQATELTDAPWTHDMHETLMDTDDRGARGPTDQFGTLNGSVQSNSQAPRVPLNRSLSTTRHLGNVQIRIFLYNMKEPIKFPPIPVNQYTRLPDHRPPLRRDKPVRISLPDHPPRYIFPAVDRSFIFIPRAMRPNQQGFGSRNRGRSGFGSIGGYSRRTSVYGGSMFGSVYTPSIAMSRRSSLAYEVPRDNVNSPAGSTMSRPPMHLDPSRPVVRLPPTGHAVQAHNTQTTANGEQPISGAIELSSIDDLPRPQTYPLPQKPTFRENRQITIPMHQPRPQKAVSVADIESPASISFSTPQQYQQPFHQQVPPQVNGNGYSHDSHMHPHSRNASFPSQASTGTPLSQIPERAIHALPFQPNPYQQPQQGYYPQQYQLMPQQGYYYPQPYGAAMAPPAPFVSAPPPQSSYISQPQQSDAAPAQVNGQSNLVAQEVNGMVYYYDASQIPAVATFPAYPAPQPYPMQQVNMGGMMTPSPDGFYYPQAPQGVIYYP